MRDNRIYKYGNGSNLMKKKKGQVTLFIVIGIVIVAAILIFFLYVQPRFDFEGTKKVGFEGCVEDAVIASVGELGKTAGYGSPEFTYKYQGEDYVYLCYTNEFFKTCTIQKPLLKQHFESELGKKLEAEIDECYSNSISQLRNEGYDVVSGDVDYEVLLDFGTVRVDIDAPTTVGSGQFTKFEVVVNSPIYEMIMIANSILSYEVNYGDYNTDLSRLLHADYNVRKITRGDSTTIYMISNKIGGPEFRFASRSLVWPAGYIQ
jgi:hypothetical protein